MTPFSENIKSLIDFHEQQQTVLEHHDQHILTQPEQQQQQQGPLITFGLHEDHLIPRDSRQHSGGQPHQHRNAKQQNHSEHGQQQRPLDQVEQLEHLLEAVHRLVPQLAHHQQQRQQQQRPQQQQGERFGDEENRIYEEIPDDETQGLIHQREVRLMVCSSGCGSVGRAVASDTRGLRFESRHRQIFKEHLFTAKCIIEKTKIKEKEAELGPFLNIIGLL